MPSNEELERRFVYHRPTEETQKLHESWRNLIARMGYQIDNLEDSLGGHTDTREKALALTALEECSFWVHAHIARNLSTKGKQT